MKTIFSILLAVLFIGSVKLIIVSGVDAEINQYIDMLKNLTVIEVVLWFVIAISARNILNNHEWYQGTFTSSCSVRLVKNADGDVVEQVQSSFGSTPDYDAAKKAYNSSKYGFIAALLALFILWFV